MTTTTIDCRDMSWPRQYLMYEMKSIASKNSTSNETEAGMAGQDRPYIYCGPLGSAEKQM